MRVICIESVCWYSNNNIAIHKGSIYNVIKIKKSSELDIGELKIELDHHWEPGKWYELLEIQGNHHSKHFLEIPDDQVEDEVEEAADFIGNVVKE